MNLEMIKAIRRAFTEEFGLRTFSIAEWKRFDPALFDAEIPWRAGTDGDDSMERIEAWLVERGMVVTEKRNRRMTVSY
jgi:hypothetical protein